MGWKTRLKWVGQQTKWVPMTRIVWGDQFLYISHKFDYKFVSWLLQCFSLDFSILFLSLFPILYYLSLSSPPFVCILHVQARWLVLTLVPSTPSWSLYVVAVRLKTTIQVSCNKGIIVNLYKLHFLSSHFSFQPNKRVFHPPTFPPLQLNAHEGKLNLFYLPTFPSSH